MGEREGQGRRGEGRAKRREKGGGWSRGEREGERGQGWERGKGSGTRRGGGRRRKSNRLVAKEEADFDDGEDDVDT